MKKIIPILLIGMFVLGGLEAGALSEIKENTLMEKTEIITLSNPTVIEADKYISVELSEATSLLMNAGEPVLPKITKVYTLPVGSNVKDVSVEFSNSNKEVLSREIRPAPEPIIEGNDIKKPLKKSEVVYSSNELYPESSFNYRIASGRYRNEHVMFLIVTCYPIRYSPAENLLLSYNDIEIKFSYENPSNPATTNDGYDLLIIAPSEFSTEVQPLIDHKNSFGMVTEFTTVEDIYADYTTGRDDQENIKLFIKDEFDENAITYVLLVGGQIGQRKEWYIPVRNTNNWAGSTFEKGVDSDLYYADLY
ncbi:MAG: peptidase C25, partial [Thermoplasmatales archaeon]|nr:peptidase C25 [Thermoplasmatales archaeon]